MKKIIFFIILTMLFTGCNNFDQEITNQDQTEVLSDKEVEPEELILLEGNLQKEVKHLRTLWDAFDQSRRNDKNPIEELKNSKYLLELKAFLGRRESLALSEVQLGYALCQPDYHVVDRAFILKDQIWHVRVIGYNVNFYEEFLTDVLAVKNKWIFVQCWNEEAFYFKTISDGDIHYFTDFMPLIINDKLHVLIAGNACPYGPYPAFVWAWRLEKEGFYPSNVFDYLSNENKTYILYPNASFADPHCEPSWMFHTDGSYLFAERGELDKEKQVNLVNVVCEIDEASRSLIFISTNVCGKQESIRLSFTENHFKVSVNRSS